MAVLAGKTTREAVGSGRIPQLYMVARKLNAEGALFSLSSIMHSYLLSLPFELAGLSALNLPSTPSLFSHFHPCLCIATQRQSYERLSRYQRLGTSSDQGHLVFLPMCPAPN